MHPNWKMVKRFKCLCLEQYDLLTCFLGLRKIKASLLETLKDCETRECKEVQKQYEIGRLDENDFDYDKVNFKIPLKIEI